MVNKIIFVSFKGEYSSIAPSPDPSLLSSELLWCKSCYDAQLACYISKLAKQRFCVLNILPLHEILAFVFSKSRITLYASVNAPHLHIFIFSFSCPLFYSEGSRAQQPWEVSNTSQLSAISNSFAVFSPKRHKVRSEIKSPHLVLGRLLGGFPVSVASRIGFANIF